MGSAVAILARRIYTSFSPLRSVEALIVRRGRVVYAGSRDKAIRLVRDLGGEVVEYQNSSIIPGLIDAHAHLDSLGLSLNSLDLRGTGSIEELRSILRNWSSKTSGWVFGRGWDQERFREGRYPTRWDIDDVLSDRPAILVRVCGHMALLNTAAARALRIEELAGGRAIRNERGEFTGLVVEEGVELAMRQFWEGVDDLTLMKYLVDAADHAVRYGVTTLGYVGTSLRVLGALMRCSAEGVLRARVRAYLNLESFRKVAELGLRAPIESGRVRVVGVKLFADGSLGARTAYLSEPYDDAPDIRGVKLMSGEDIELVGRQAEELGFQVAIHAIGDAALDEVIKGFRGLRGRHRIEHLSVVRDDQIGKLEELGVVGVVQPHFIVTDWWVIRRVGPRRASWVYRFRSLGRYIQLALSTDTPVEPIDPWETVYAAVTRGRGELAEYSESEKLSVIDALHYYTYGSAYALREERELGKLEPGYRADFVILDRDPLEIESEELRKIRVLEVYVDGEKSYPR